MKKILGGALMALLLASPSQADDWELGYVYNGVNGGDYDVYDNDGNFIETINNGIGGFTTGAAFNADFSKLYTTSFSSSEITVYDGNDPHSVIQRISTAPFGGGSAESIAFDALGCFYVGHAGGNQDVMRFDAAGNFLQQFDVASDAIGSDWIDLSADQETLFYCSRVESSFDTMLPTTFNSRTS